MAYPWIKTFHLLFVIGWMAAVFYLPRLLVNIAEAADEGPVVVRLVLMGRRLRRFGHVMFGFALCFGLILWLHFDITGPWLHAKLTLVGFLMGHFIWAGRLLERAGSGAALPSSRRLRWFNELPVLLTIGVLYLALAKPF